MSNKILTNSTSLDVKGEMLQPVFYVNGQSFQDPYWYCAECEDTLGGEPGHATIVIANKMGSVDERAWSVAHNPDGPMANIKHGTFVAIQKRYSLGSTIYSPVVWSGRVTEIKIDSENDRLIVTAEDGRVALKDVRVIGQYMYVPPWLAGIQDKIYFRLRWGSHFNPGGRPNCIFTPSGTPCFSPHPDFGLDKDEEPPSSDELSTTKSCYWSFGTMMAHYRAFYAYETPTDQLAIDARAEVTSLYPWIARFPSWITWPVGFGSGLDIVSEANFNNAVGQTNATIGRARKGRDFNASGFSFVGEEGQSGVFDQMFDAAGGMSWKMQFLVVSSGPTGISNILTSTPKRFLNASEAVDLPLIIGGNAKDSMKDPGIIHSDYTESSRYTLTRAAAISDYTFIETRCSSIASDHAASGGIAAIVPAWTDADFDAFITEAVTLGGGTPSPYTFRQAGAKYWWVLTTYMLNPSFNFQYGTSENGKPRAVISRPLWPALLSFSSSASHGPGDILPYPINFEIFDGSSWKKTQDGDGLTLFDNGIFYIPALRDCVAQSIGSTNPEIGTFRFNNPSTPWVPASGQLDISVNDIRATLAIPCDHGLSYAVKTVAESGPDAETGSGSALANPMAILDDSPDIDRLDPSFVRGTFVDLKDLYKVWLRYNSYPEPETSGAAAAPDMPNANSNALRNDLDYFQSHVNRMLIDRFGLDVSGGWTYGGTFLTSVGVGTAVGNLVRTNGDKSQDVKVPVRRVIGRRLWLSEKSRDDNGNEIFINFTKLFPI